MKTFTRTVDSWGAITPEDQSLLFRAVGTFEYHTSLRNLDAFLSSASSEEVAAADKIVSSRPQFTIYTRLADRFRTGQESPQLSLERQAASQKKGLMWVVALARLELGAALGIFTRTPSPFEIVGPTRWEAAAYKELLMDGAQTHYLALTQDANVSLVLRKIPDTEILAYIRRLNLARSMLDAAARSNAQDLLSGDWAQLQAQDRQMLSTLNLYSAKVNKYLASLNFNKTTTTTEEQQISKVKACLSQLAGEQRELSAGTAKVRTFSLK